MERPAPFSLTDAAANWLDRLRQSGTLSADDVEELKTHLLDSVEALQATGLTDEEAFLIASRRLGPKAALTQEFGKLARSRPLQRETVLLMAGALGLVILRNIVDIVLSKALFLLMGVTGITRQTALLYTGLCMAVLVLVAALLFALLRHGKAWQARFFSLLHRRPAAVGLCMAALLASSGTAAFLQADDLDTVVLEISRSHHAFGEVLDTYYLFWVAFYLALLMAFLHAAIRHTHSVSFFGWLRNAPAGWLIAAGVCAWIVIAGFGVEAARQITPVGDVARRLISAGGAGFLIALALAGSKRHALPQRLLIALAPSVLWYLAGLVGRAMIGQDPSFLVSASYPLAFFCSALAGVLVGQWLGGVLHPRTGPAYRA